MVLHSVGKQYYQSSNNEQKKQQKRQSIDNSMIRFPKLDECAHFHYEFAELNNFHVSLINENYYCNHNKLDSDSSSTSQLSQQTINLTNIRNLYLFVRVQCSNRSWTVRRNLQDFRFLDLQLHKCVFDRKHSKLKPLNLTYISSSDSLESIVHFVAEYLEQLSQIVSFLTCGLVLHWFEIDNRGNRLIHEDINTPAIGAAFVIKKHDKSDVETEISLEIGELVSVIDMPPANESFYWKGKKGLEVGFFPAECVQLIDDKISRQTEELPLRPLNKCSPTLLHRTLASNCEFVAEDNEHYYLNHQSQHHISGTTRHSYYSSEQMRKQGLLASIFRAFASGRNGTSGGGDRKRKGQVFGYDLCQHLINTGDDLPLVLTTCVAYIERYGLNANGIYRLSSVSSTTNRLRAIFDENHIPPELDVQSEQPKINSINNDTANTPNTTSVDIHAVSSLLKLYFRELPNPLLTFSLYEPFMKAMRDQTLDEHTRLQAIRSLVNSLPQPHWRTLRFLMRHLAYVSKFDVNTGMTPKNLAIVWAPNLLRSRDLGQHFAIEALHLIGTQAVLTEYLILNCDKIFDREEHEIHPSKPLYSPFLQSKCNGNGHFAKCFKYIDVGPEIKPGKYHTIIAYRPPNQTKRSKFNLQNLKKFHFFSTRTASRRHRPSLFREENNTSSSSPVDSFQKSNNLDSASLSTNGGDYFQQSECRRRMSSKLLGDRNKSVKRSQSFDSYFRKLRAYSNNGNTNCCSVFSQEKQSSDCTDSNDSNQNMMDINRNQFESHITKNTIFEIEEMSIDCESPVDGHRNGDSLYLRYLLDTNQRNEMNNNLPEIGDHNSADKCNESSLISSAVVCQPNLVLQNGLSKTTQSTSEPVNTAPVLNVSSASDNINDTHHRENSSGSLQLFSSPADSFDFMTTNSFSTLTNSVSSSTVSLQNNAQPDVIHEEQQMNPQRVPIFSSKSSTSSVSDSEKCSVQSNMNEPLVCSTINTNSVEEPQLESLTSNNDISKQLKTAALSHSSSDKENHSTSDEQSQSCLTLCTAPLNSDDMQSSMTDAVVDISTQYSPKLSTSTLPVCSPSPSPPPSGSETKTTISNKALVNCNTSVAMDTQGEGEISPVRELIEKIKEERRLQIRKNFIQQHQPKRIESSNRSPSRIPVALPSFIRNSVTQEETNLDSFSTVRLRNKPTTNRATRSTTLHSSLSITFDSSSGEGVSSKTCSNKHYQTENRRSVPNLESQLQSPSSKQLTFVDQTPSSFESNSDDKVLHAKDSNYSNVEQTGSFSYSVKQRRSKVAPITGTATVLSHSNVGAKDDQHENSKANKASPRMKLTVTPLRAINKRQRTSGPKSVHDIVHMFERSKFPNDKSPKL